VVMVAFGSMRMAVLELFRSRFADRLHRHIEVERLSSERMVQVDHHRVAANFPDRNGELLAVLALPDELHPGFRDRPFGERGTRHFLNAAGIMLAVTFFRGDHDLLGVVGRKAFQRVFETWNNVAFAMEVAERRTRLTLIHDFAVAQVKLVIEVHDAALAYLHISLQFRVFPGGTRVHAPSEVEKYRVQYRAENIGPHYRGWLHLTFTSLGSLGAIVFAIAPLNGVRPTEWLVVPLSFAVANLAEYFGHKGPMHLRKKGLSLLFQRHTEEHHHFFTHQAMTYESSTDFKMVLFPPEMLLFFLGGIATPLGLAMYFLAGPNAGWLFLATAMSYFLTYEWLHFCYHLPEAHWLSRQRWIRALRRHHTAHHNPALMGRWNYNITFPICDALFGTRYRGERSS
jgi:hypothetical protein